MATIRLETDDDAARDDIVAWRGGVRLAQRLTRVAAPGHGAARAIRADGAYVVTGGLGGIGLVVARWLLDGGAGRVVLSGRTQPDGDRAAALAALQAAGDVAYVAGDIAEAGVADRLVAAAEQTGLALRGVVHSAAVLDDELITALTPDAVARVWAPKVAGTLRLDAATAGRDLDWWIGFSSVAALLGSPGQGAYACANAWLDAHAAARRAAGAPVVAIDWGQWSDVGLARALTMDALDPISPAEGREALDAVAAGTVVGGVPARIGVARLRLDRAAAAFPELLRLGYFAPLAAELAGDDGDDWPGPEALVAAGGDRAGELALERLQRRISAVMGYGGTAAVDPDRPLTELGMDSLMAVRIRNAARGDFGVEPAVALLLQGATLRDLAADVVRQLGIPAADDGAGQDGGDVDGESGPAAAQAGSLRERSRQRAAARQRAATRRKTGQHT
ncbi:hypothetical protein GCM10023147_46330 [Tsukamurella soli]|uniref:Carrier domain-containing protein n=1 Tax=Tsukamurella soli TaxID=644556 RepID=A0ABP8KCG5_9ACTN